MKSNEKPPAYPAKTFSRVACIGTGFSGINVGASLKRWYSITDVQFFDRSSSCAGTWTNNTYPGCACDVPGALYSLSYEPNPNWTRILPRQPEIKQYLESVAEKYGLVDKMHFNTEVEKCIWDDYSKTWTLHLHNLQTGERWLHESPVLFSCAGGLVHPRPLDVSGVESFRGPIFHSAQWDHSVDLKDKKVAVIGNGCTGSQLVPALVKEVGVKSLTHLVRSKHWVFPSFDREYPGFMQWAFKNIPFALKFHRFTIYAITEISWPAFKVSKRGAKLRAYRQNFAEKYIRRAAPEKYHDMLIPDFEIGCKRRIFDTGYMQILHHPKVNLTNQPIREIVPTGIRTDDGIIEADAIVLANGFQIGRSIIAMHIAGRNGVSLSEQWSQQGGPGAYNTVGVSGFPNMFFVIGPNSGTGHTSAVIAAENSTNLALRVLKPVFEGKATTVEPDKAAEDKWTADVQEANHHLVWFQGGCKTWYVQENRWVTALYPYSQADFWWRCTFPRWSDWQYISVEGTAMRYYGLDRFILPLTILLAFGAVVFYLL